MYKMSTNFFFFFLEGPLKAELKIAFKTLNMALLSLFQVIN